jgi:MOSC domain-containing protein YiiM
MGKVEAIYISREAAGQVEKMDATRAIPGKGLEGDRYYQQAGTFSNKNDKKRDVTLIEIEAIEALAMDYEATIDPGDTRRNIVTRGVALNHLVGREFCIGEVRLRGVELCEPCSHLANLTSYRVLKGLIHRGGLRAEVLTEGEIHINDAVTIPSI